MVLQDLALQLPKSQLESVHCIRRNDGYVPLRELDECEPSGPLSALRSDQLDPEDLSELGEKLHKTLLLETVWNV